MKATKKFTWIIILISMLFGIWACTEPSEPSQSEPTSPPINEKLYRTSVKTDVSQVIIDEHELGFKFFWELANTNLESPGYGLIPDRFHTFTNTKGSVSSIASVGFGLSALPVGIEAGWITRAEGEQRAYHTLLTLQNMQRTHGFWYHFVDMQTGLRVWQSEVSIIDSAILINGALVVGRYFGGEIEELAYQLYEEMEWNWYFDAMSTICFTWAISQKQDSKAIGMVMLNNS
jgi:hypothetical protein